MAEYVLKTLVGALLLQHALARLDPRVLQIADEYFHHKHIRVIVAVLCTQQDAVQLLKSTDLWVSVVEPGANIEVSQLCSSSLKPGVLVDGDCPMGMKTLENGRERGMLAGNATWFVWSQQLPSSDTAMQGLRIDTELIWATPQEECVTLVDVYQVHQGWPLSITYAGQWLPNEGLRYLLPEEKFSGRRNLQGRILQAAITINNLPPENLEERLVSLKQRNMDIISRFNYAVFHNLQQVFNFSMQLVPTRSWGYLQKDGSFDGAIGFLIDGQVELSVSSCIMRAYRLNVVDFAGPSWMFRSWIMFRHPPTLGVHGTLLLPFSRTVWITTIIIFILIMLMVRIQHWVEHQYNTNSKTEDSWSMVLIYTIGAVAQQGTSSESTWITWRIIIIITTIMAFMLDTYYSAAVVYSLLLPPPKTIRSKRELIDSPLEVGMEDISYTRDYFEKTTDPLGKELYHKKVFPPGSAAPTYVTLQEGVERMRTQRFAFHAEEVSIFPLIRRTFSEHDICALWGIPLFENTMTYHPIGKDSPLKKMIAIGLRLLWERGHLKHHENVWRPQKLTCTDSGESAVVGLEALSPAFLILIMGMLGSVVVLLIEYFKTQNQMKPATAVCSFLS